MGTGRLNLNQNEEVAEREEKQEEIQMEICLSSSKEAITCMCVYARRSQWPH